MRKPFKKPVAAFLALMICFSFSACGDVSRKELIEYKAQSANFTLMLPKGFEERTDNESLTCYFESESELVTCLRETKEEIISVANDSDVTLEEYAKLVVDINGLSSSIGTDSKGNIYFTYNQHFDNTDYFYYAVVKESEDAFWLFNFVCSQAEKDSHIEAFANWASQIKL